MKTVDMDEGCSMSCSSKIFKFDGLYGNAFLIIVLPLLFLSIGIREFLNGHYLGALVLVVPICFFLMLGYIQVLFCANVIIDDEYISRFAFGRLIQRVRWDRVRLIRISGEFNGPGSSYNIYPIKTQESQLGLIGKLAFSDKMSNADKFINVMNSNIIKYNIKIESIVGGVKTFPIQLPDIKKWKKGVREKF